MALDAIPVLVVGKDFRTLSRQLNCGIDPSLRLWFVDHFMVVILRKRAARSSASLMNST